MITEASFEQQRRLEFIRHIHALNDQFGQYVASALQENLDHVLVDASNDYIQYVPLTILPLDTRPASSQLTLFSIHV